MVLISSQEMKFLIVGLGSAGQRHARAIRNLFPRAQIEAYVGDHNLGLISPDLKNIDYEIDPRKFYEISEVANIDQLNSKYDLTIIATPISSHFYFFEKTILQSKRIIIEKPIGDNTDDAKAIIKAATELNLPVLVGYQHNFNPLVREILDYCDHRLTPSHIEMKFHEYLFDMNPFRDMRNHHLADPRGGGAYLALSHEIDLLLQIPGVEMASLRLEMSKSGEFKDVLDQANVSSRLTSGSKSTPQVLVSLSYAKGEKVRSGRVRWGDEYIYWDFISGEFRIKSNSNESKKFITQVSGDELIALQTLFLLNKKSLDLDLLQRLTRAESILSLNQ